jgi:TctA family transporter
MTIQILWWVLYIIAFCFSLWSEYTPGQVYPYNHGARSLITFVLIGILGWKTLGF